VACRGGVPELRAHAGDQRTGRAVAGKFPEHRAAQSAAVGVVGLPGRGLRIIETPERAAVEGPVGAGFLVPEWRCVACRQHVVILDALFVGTARHARRGQAEAIADG